MLQFVRDVDHLGAKYRFKVACASDYQPVISDASVCWLVLYTHYSGTIKTTALSRRETIFMTNVSKIALAFILGCAINQAVMADDTSSATETHSSGSGSTTNKYKASSGPGGAKVSHTKTNVQANGDGSVSATKQHESHAVGAGGSTHHRSASATTLNPDGSASSAHSSTTTNNR